MPAARKNNVIRFTRQKKPGDSRRSSKWRAARAAHLKREPTCRACGGTEDLEVHHCLPFHVDASQELDEANLITLCEKPDRNCHLTFGHAYSWLTWNPHVRDDAEQWLRRVQGIQGEARAAKVQALRKQLRA